MDDRDAGGGTAGNSSFMNPGKNCSILIHVICSRFREASFWEWGNMNIKEKLNKMCYTRGCLYYQVATSNLLMVVPLTLFAESLLTETSKTPCVDITKRRFLMLSGMASDYKKNKQGERERERVRGRGSRFRWES